MGVSRMSLIETYRRAIKRNKEDLRKLKSSRATETGKVSSHKKKIISARAAIDRTKSTATINSKNREIEGEDKKLFAIDKKVGEIDKQIAKKEADILTEERKLNREVDREQKKRDAKEKKMLADSEKRMKAVDGMVNKHSEMHQDTNQALEELQKLPEEITVLFIASNPLDAPQLRLDEAARIFSAYFYSAIGFGFSVKKAFEQGKAALMLEGIPEEDTPELYVREGLNPNELIIVKPQF